MKNLFKLLFFFNLCIIFAFWISGSSSLLDNNPSNLFLAFGRLFGLLGIFFVLVQLVLIGRIYWIEDAFGHDKLAIYHHKLARFSIMFILSHFVLVLSSYAMLGDVDLLSQLQDFFQNYDDTFKAFVALLLFVVVVVSSVSIVRLKLKYEAWYFVHFITYIAILLAFGHQLELGGDFVNKAFVLYWLALYLVVLGSFMAFRFGRPIYYFNKHKFFVKSINKETWDTNSIIISGTKMSEFKRKSGQFFILRFLDKKRFWQAHPFSLSWSQNHDDIRITPKNSGDFTADIQKIKLGTKVVIDGPLGSFTKDKSAKNKYLFIGGGIGITPIRSLIEDLGKENLDMILLYSNKLLKDIVFKDELFEFSNRYKLNVYDVLTEEKNYKGEKGRIEIGRIDKEKINRLVNDVKAREVYICGPKPFMDAMILSLKELGVPDSQIHYEKFSLH